MASPRTWFALAVVVASCVVSASLAAAQGATPDPLARAKDLYASAEYEQALSILSGVEFAGGGVEVDQYRALCLLALGRNDDAMQVIQRMVEKNPLFEPSAGQVSPRVQTTFRDARKRMLPAIVRQTYTDGKTAFDAGDMAKAKERFEGVVAEVDALEALGSKDFGDLRVLAKGFVDLIARSAKPAPAPTPAPPPPPAPEPVARPATTPPPSSTIHVVGEPGLTPPVVISQVTPPWRPNRQDTQTYEGVVSVVIDETGSVTDITTQGALPPAYDAALRRSAMNWKYRPATLRGVPVKYRKNVAVRLSSDQTP
jgi:hypothetical protein